MSVSVSVCVCLSVREHIFGTARPIFTKFFVHATYGRGSVPVWWRRYVCTSGFMDDVIFAYLLLSQGCSTSPPSWTAVHTTQPCAVIPVAGQRTHGTTFRNYMYFSWQHRRAESAVYDCLVLFQMHFNKQLLQSACIRRYWALSWIGEWAEA